MSYSLGVWQAMQATVYVADKVQLGEFDFVPTSRLAEDLGIPAPSMARLLRSLNRAGIIETREGARGGVRLALPPDQVTLLSIVDAIEQSSAAVPYRFRPPGNRRHANQTSGSASWSARGG